MEAYSTNEVKLAEKEVINSGISEETLIDRASNYIYNALKEHKGAKAFLVGGGNNGSDALACALKMTEKVKIYPQTFKSLWIFFVDRRTKSLPCVKGGGSRTG